MLADRCSYVVGLPTTHFYDDEMMERVMPDQDVGMKLCCKCGDEWPATTEFFFRNRTKRKDGSYGLYSPCKACISEQIVERSKVKPCCVPGCGKPRRVGKYFRCEEHQIEYQQNYRQKLKAQKAQGK